MKKCSYDSNDRIRNENKNDFILHFTHLAVTLQHEYQ